MRLNDERTKELQALLKELFGLDHSVVETQEVGLAVMRFVLAKTNRQQELSNYKEK